MLTKELCVSCLEVNEEKPAECEVSEVASKLWNLDINDKFCWTCWDEIHYEYQDYDNNGYCHCDLCNYVEEE
tara:strand:- start:638 stop:853 length:216 start_codon:yes stop_codon:yes gene_type:complete